MKLSNRKKIVYIIVGIITFLTVNFFLNFEKNYKEMKKGYQAGMENN